MDYDDEGLSSHDEDNVSDEDEELGEMGPIEGLHGDPVLEVIVGDEDEMDEDDDDEDTSDESDDDDEDMDSDEFEDEEDRVQIAVEENDLMEDDGNPEWESATDSDEDDDEALGFDAEGPILDDDLHHHHHHHHHHHLSDGEILGNITRAVIGAETDFDPDDVDDLGDAYMDDGRDDDGMCLFVTFLPGLRGRLTFNQKMKRTRTLTMMNILTMRTILVCPCYISRSFYHEPLWEELLTITSRSSGIRNGSASPRLGYAHGGSA